MNCPKCNVEATMVIDSREPVSKNFIRRRRKCVSSECSFRFTTHESIFKLKQPIGDRIIRDIRKILRFYEQEKATHKNPYSKELK